MNRMHRTSIANSHKTILVRALTPQEVRACLIYSVVASDRDKRREWLYEYLHHDKKMLWVTWNHVDNFAEQLEGLGIERGKPEEDDNRYWYRQCYRMLRRQNALPYMTYARARGIELCRAKVIRSIFSETAAKNAVASYLFAHRFTDYRTMTQRLNSIALVAPDDELPF